MGGRNPPGCYTNEDAPGTSIILDGVEYVLDETGHSAELAAALARRAAQSEAIAAEMRDAALARNPCGNPYKS